MIKVAKIDVSDHLGNATVPSRPPTMIGDNDESAILVSLAYGSIRKDETVAIAGKALDATLTFGRQVPISYSVTASASFVDSSLANTAGAKPSVVIKGDFVRVTIR